MALPRMRKDRLQELRKVMQRVKPEVKLGPNDTRVFDMDNFFAMRVKPPSVSLDARGVCRSEEGFCHTAACALGTAALHPPFNRAGLRIRIDPDKVDQARRDRARNGYEDIDNEVYVGGEVQYLSRSGEEFTDFEAGEKFFGLTEKESDHLFDPGSYRRADQKNGRVTTKAVIRHIDEVLSGEFREDYEDEDQDAA